MYEDFSETSFLILSPFQSSTGVRLLRARSVDSDALGFYLNAVFTVRSFLLLHAELPYIAVTGDNSMADEFGDFFLRARVRLVDRTGAHFYLTGRLRSGSGANTIYPYASGSVDVGLGAAFVDSLSLFTLWGDVSAVKVNRKTTEEEEVKRHDDCVLVSLGISIPWSEHVAFNFGAGGYLLRTGGSRDIYFSQLSYRHAAQILFFISAQAEGGKREERILDVGINGGFQVYY